MIIPLFVNELQNRNLRKLTIKILNDILSAKYKGDSEMALDGITIKNLAKELNQKLSGGKIQKIYQPDFHTIVILIRNNHKDYYFVYSETKPFVRAYISEKEITGTSSNPPAFCMLLRKHLLGNRIGEIHQEKWDRILRISIDQLSGNKIITKELIIELTGRLTNLILVDETQTIVDAMHRVSGAKNIYRAVVPREKYLLPPSQQKYPPDDFDIIRMANSLHRESPDFTVKKILQDRFEGLGPYFLDEILYRSHIEKENLNAEITIDSWEKLLSILFELVDEAKTNPSFYYFKKKNSNTGIISLIDLMFLNDASYEKASSVSDAIEKLIISLGEQDTGKKSLWKELIKNETQRLRKRENYLNEDKSKWLSSPPYQLWGDLLMIYLQDIPLWTPEIEVSNLFAPPEENTLKILITLDMKKTPLENAQAFYQLQKKVERAKEAITIQQNKLSEEMYYLDTLEHSLDQATSFEDFEEIYSELLEAGLLKEKKGNKLSKSHHKLGKPLSFSSPSGFPILVGRNNVQNDRVTFKESTPSSLWFHAQKIPGSHVILNISSQIPLEEIEEDLIYAAELAAYYSKGKNSDKLPVDYTFKKNVWKPKNAKPGFVLYDSQKTIYVQPKNKESTS